MKYLTSIFAIIQLSLANDIVIVKGRLMCEDKPVSDVRVQLTSHGYGLVY
jgi:hypothetical protein